MTHSTATNSVLQRLHNVRPAGDGKWTARCPAHDDKQNSLSVSAADDGKTLLHCHAGCTANDVVAAAGLKLADLFPANDHATTIVKPIMVAKYNYCDRKENLLYQVCRYHPKTFRQRRPNDDGTWTWNLADVRRVLYRLPELIAAIESDENQSPQIFVVEGEKDADKLAELGLKATCNAGGAGKWQPDFGDMLCRCHVVILPDNDTPGRKHAHQVAKSCVGKAGSIRVVALPGLPEKGDVSDWLAAGGTKETLLSLSEATAEWQPTAEPIADDNPEPARPVPVSVGKLIDDHPRLADPVIHGLLRCGETANIVSSSKIGKSWLAYHLAFSVIAGRQFLDSFDCAPGKVLLIDNELHPATLAFRLWTVGNAMAVQRRDYEQELDVLAVRGRQCDLYGIENLLDEIEAGDYSLVIFDAWYRGLPPGVSENDNSAVMSMYNKIDGMSARLNCAWVNVHHSSKGSQGDKAVTDVGSGAGSQSRAADSHIILRPHEEDGAIVLEAAVRSFPPVEPLSLRWQFPLWRPDDSLDVGKLKGRLNPKEQKQNAADQEGMEKIIATLKDGPATIRILRGKTGISKYRTEKLLDALEGKGRVKWQEIDIRGNRCRQYEVLNDVTQPNNGNPHANGYIDF